MEKMRDAPLRNELGSLPSPYSNFVFPPIQNPDDFICFYLPQFSTGKGHKYKLQCTLGILDASLIAWVVTIVIIQNME